MPKFTYQSQQYNETLIVTGFMKTNQVVTFMPALIMPA